MMALHLSGVVFGREWELPQLQPWEGPFPDPTQRLPQHPKVAAERRGSKRRYRLRREIRERGRAGSGAQRAPKHSYTVTAMIGRSIHAPMLTASQLPLGITTTAAQVYQ
jgi:hypothetical protein